MSQRVQQQPVEADARAVAKPPPPMPARAEPAGTAALGRRLGPYGLLALGVVVADQLSKWWAVVALTRPPGGAGGPPSTLAASWEHFWSSVHPLAAGGVTVVANFFHLRYVENPGAAWGLLARTQATWRTPLLAAVALVAMAVAVGSLYGSLPHQRGLRAGLGLLLGGALGNLIDRLRLGYVIDFIDWHWYQVVAWPTFNVADACISTGAGLLLLDALTQARRPAPAPHPQQVG